MWKLVFFNIQNHTHRKIAIGGEKSGKPIAPPFNMSSRKEPNKKNNKRNGALNGLNHRRYTCHGTIAQPIFYVLHPRSSTLHKESKRQWNRISK